MTTQEVWALVGALALVAVFLTPIILRDLLGLRRWQRESRAELDAWHAERKAAVTAARAAWEADPRNPRSQADVLGHETDRSEAEELADLLGAEFVDAGEVGGWECDVCFAQHEGTLAEALADGWAITSPAFIRCPAHADPNGSCSCHINPPCGWCCP